MSFLSSVAFQFLRFCCISAGVSMSSTVLIGKWSDECSMSSARSQRTSLLVRLKLMKVRSITDDWSFRDQVALPSSVINSRSCSFVISSSSSASLSALVPRPPYVGWCAFISPNTTCSARGRLASSLLSWARVLLPGLLYTLCTNKSVQSLPRWAFLSFSSW